MKKSQRKNSMTRRNELQKDVPLDCPIIAGPASPNR
jgi:hypothetical protein